MTDSNKESSSGSEFQVLSTPTNMKNPKKIINIFTEDVVDSLDRVNLFDRNVMLVVRAIAQGLGTPISDISLLHSTICRNRYQSRQTIVETDKACFSSQKPLVLHWDGKLLHTIVRGVQKVDRVSVLVRGDGLEKLLKIPEIKKGTSKEQTEAF